MQRRDAIHERVFRWWDYPIFIAISAFTVFAVVELFEYWIAVPDWQTAPITMVVISALLLNNLTIQQYRWLSLLLMRRPRPLPAPVGLRVAAVTTFVPRAEPIDMLEVTLRAMVAMDYAHDNWVLDEGDDPAVRALCARLGARHFSRKDLAQYQTDEGQYQRRTKHGNYNAWLTEAGFDNYDVVVAFDPDHVPRSHFLTRVLGYFSDPRVGYVQAAQVYYNQRASFIARGAAEETYTYYSSTQMACHAIGYPIVTGCHQSHRASALREVGGFAAHDADDLLITMLYRAAGWKGVYVPEVLAEGITPVDWNGYLRQQVRWARSVLDVKFRAYPRYASKLRLSERLLSLLHGMYYFQGLTILIGVCVLVGMLLLGRSPTFLSRTLVPRAGLLAFAVLCANLYTQRFFLRPRLEAGVHWRAGILQFAKWPYLLLGLIEAMGGERHPYTVTLKVRAGETRRLLTGPHVAIAAVVTAAWLFGLLFHGLAHPAIEATAFATVGISLGFAWSDRRMYPPPYERRVWDEYASAHVGPPPQSPTR